MAKCGWKYLTVKMKIIFCLTCLCFISFSHAGTVDIINSDSSEGDEDSPQKDPMFADVIKNITRVNNVLQDLIKNYEKLQKIYPSRESLDSYSDDDRQEENFRDGIQKLTVTVKLPNTTLAFPATNMYGPQSAESNETETTTKSKLRVPLIEPLLSVAKDNKELANTGITKKAINNTRVQKPRKDVNRGNEDNNSKSIDSLEIKFGDESNKGPAGIVSFNIGRTSEQMSKLDDIELNTNTTLVKRNATVVNTRQIIKTEAFQPNKIWTDIGNNRQLELKTEKEIVLNKRTQDDSEEKQEVEPKHDVKKPKYKAKKIKHNVKEPQEAKKDVKKPRKSTKEPKIGKPKSNLKVKDVQTHNSNKNNSKHDTYKITTSESSETDSGIKKFQFQSMILRRAYGDACLKVVIKKCYKALSNALKRCCQIKKCKSEFKEIFRQSSKAGCIQEFDVGSAQNNDSTSNSSAVDKTDANITTLFKKNKRTDAPKYDLYMDLTRNGYLSSVCLPDGQDNAKLRQKTQTRFERRPAVSENLTYLRDRFEKECQKESQSKCLNACSFASDQACSTVECDSNRKKFLTKSCKAECKNAYARSLSVGKGSSDDSDDDSDTDSD